MKQEQKSVNPVRHLDRTGSAAIDWKFEARCLLKSVLVRNGVSINELVERLSKIGVKDERKNIEAKLRRGAFSAAFLIQCMNALNINELSPVLIRGPKSPERRAEGPARSSDAQSI